MRSIIRSKARWLKEGEIPTDYFINLENRHFTNKLIPKFINEENSNEITNQKNILIELENYYKTLYQCKEDHTEFDLRIDKSLSDSSFIKMNDTQKEALEGEITINEATHVLKNMSNKKSLGSDGFSTEFFKVTIRIFYYNVIKLYDTI